jgi:hypothetical protein
MNVILVAAFLTLFGFWYLRSPDLQRPYAILSSIIQAGFGILAVAIVILRYAIIFRDYGILDDGQRKDDPVTCLYFSIVTWTTLGYGDLKPTPQIRLVAASEAIAGYIGMAMFIAFFADMFNRLKRTVRSIDLSRLLIEQAELQKNLSDLRGVLADQAELRAKLAELMKKTKGT